jgi:hypothetical protein
VSSADPAASTVSKPLADHHSTLLDPFRRERRPPNRLQCGKRRFHRAPGGAAEILSEIDDWSPALVVMGLVPASDGRSIQTR